MVHPADFAGSELTQAEAPGGQVAIRHRLFVQRLEKGVLLRARVRGMFVRARRMPRWRGPVSAVCRFGAGRWEPEPQRLDLPLAEGVYAVPVGLI